MESDWLHADWQADKQTKQQESRRTGSRNRLGTLLRLGDRWELTVRGRPAEETGGGVHWDNEEEDCDKQSHMLLWKMNMNEMETKFTKAFAL